MPRDTTRQPFVRRSQVGSRTFYARGQTGQQLLLGAYAALSRQISLGKVKMFTRHEMADLIVIDGRAKGVVVRKAFGSIWKHCLVRHPNETLGQCILTAKSSRQGAL